MELIITAILASVLLLILYWLASSNDDYWKIRGLPYVKSLPLIGNSLDILLMKKSFVQQSVDIYKQLDGEKFGGFKQFTKPVLLLRDPEIINQILIKDFTSFHDRGFPVDTDLDPLSISLVNLTGDYWRQVRHKLTPTFTSGKLKNMFDQIVECSDDAVNFLRNKKEAIEVKAYLQKFNLNVIGLVAFGLKVDAFDDKNETGQTFVRYGTTFFAPSMKRLLLFFLKMSFPKIGKVLKIPMMEPKVSDFFINLVKDTVEYREKTNIKRNDFIQLMLDLKQQELLKLSQNTGCDNNVSKQTNHNEEHDDAEDKELLEQLQNTPTHEDTQAQVFTDMCIAAQAFIFISGGSETTAGVLSFSLYELATNPKVQNRLRNEVESVLSSRNFDYRALKDMKYMEQFLNEVMRLHSPGGALQRVCTEDFVIPGTNKVLHKGELVMIPVQALHKDPQYFPDPEAFDPDRFEDMDSIPRGVFMPFGGGPRICIAMRFAMMEMKIFLAKLILKYNLTLSDKTQVPLKLMVNSFVLNVVGGLWVHFEERQ